MLIFLHFQRSSSSNKMNGKKHLLFLAFSPGTLLIFWQKKNKKTNLFFQYPPHTPKKRTLRSKSSFPSLYSLTLFLRVSASSKPPSLCSGLPLASLNWTFSNWRVWAASRGSGRCWCSGRIRWSTLSFCLISWLPWCPPRTIWSRWVPPLFASRWTPLRRFRRRRKGKERKERKPLYQPPCPSLHEPLNPYLTRVLSPPPLTPYFLRPPTDPCTTVSPLQFIRDLPVPLLGFLWPCGIRRLRTHGCREFHKILGNVDVWIVFGDQHYRSAESPHCYDVQFV